jgi:hypothetical protein
MDDHYISPMYWPQHNPSNTIKLATFWPMAVKGDGGRIAVLQQHEAVRWAYDTDMQLIDKPDELIVPPDFDIVCIEERGDDTLPITSLKHPYKALYITGNDNFRKPSDEWPDTLRVHIDVPSNGEHPLYSHQAWSIVMHDRYTKDHKAMSDNPLVHFTEEGNGKYWWSIKDDKGKAISFLSATQLDCGFWHIGDSNTDPSHRRKGYNHLLQRIRLEYIENQNPSTVMVVANNQTRDIHLSNGFLIHKEIIDAGIQEWLMMKEY